MTRGRNPPANYDWKYESKIVNDAKEEDRRTQARLRGENEELRWRLEEAEQTLEAIRTGDVDALVVTTPQGEQVCTLTGAEHVYRIIVETMNEAALIVDLDGTVLFSNQRFCDLIKTPMHEVLGRKVMTFAARPQHPCLKEVLADAQAGPVQQRVTLRAADGAAVPVQVSASLLATTGSTSICLVASDLTELEASAHSIRVLREHQQALEESESRFRTIFEASRDAIVIADDEGTYVQANPAVQTIFGLPPEKLIGHHLSEFVGDHIDVPVVWRNFRATGSFHGEMPLTSADGQVRYVDIYAVANIPPGRHLCVIRDVTERRRGEEALENANEQLQAQAEELQVQAEELRATNDELRENEQALQEAEEHLHLAMEAGRVGVWEWEVGTERVKWSQGIYRLLGCKPGEVTLTREGFRQRIHPQDRQRQAQALRESMERCEDYSCEFRVVWMDGSVHWVEDRGQYVYPDDGNGTILRLRGVLSDIDARKQSEEALRSVALFPEESPAPTLRVARDGTLLFANSASASLLRWWDCRAGQAAPEQIRQYVVQALDSQEIVEADVVCGPITYSFSIAPIASEGYANLYARDITERKRAEEALRESEQRNRRLIDNLKGSHFIYRHDTQGVFNYVSESLTDILGYTPDEFMAHYSTYLTDHPVNEAVHRHTELSIQGIRQPPYEVNAWHKDGSSRWLEVQEVPVFDVEGKVIAVEGVAQDITERKRAEEALHSIALFPEENPWPVLRVAGDGTLLYANAASTQLLELWNCQLGQPIPDEIRGQVERTLDTGEVIDAEVVCGEVVYSFSLAPIASEDYVNLYGRDVTERKQAAKALRESREWLEHTQEIAHLGSWELDLTRDELTWSDEVYRMFGLAPQEFGATYEAFLDCVYPEDRAAVDAAYTGSLRENRDTYEIEHRIVRRNTGEIRFVHEKCEHFRDDAGRIARSVGMVHDITERKRAEEGLRESEQRYHRLFEDDLTGNFICTPEGQILLCNPSFARTFGFARPQEAVGTSMLDLYLDPQEREALLERLKQQGKIDRFEVWRKRRDGEPIYIVENLIGHFNEQGELYEIKGYVFDDTERKRAEEALRESEQRYRTVGETIPYGVWLTDASGYCTYVSNSFLELVGITMEEVQQFGWLHLLPSKDVEPTREHWLRCVATGEPFEQEHRFRTKEGDYRHVLAIGRPIRDEQGRIISWAGINLDITERKQAEEALRESEERLRLAQQAARIGTFEWNVQTGVDRWTPELEAMYGLPPGGFGGTQEAWEQLVHPEDREEAKRRVARAFETGAPTEWEWRVVWPDGSVHWVAGRWQVFRDESGDPLRMTGINIDITERKWAEEAVRESEERLRQAAQAAHFGVYDADLVADRVYCSPEMREILGLPADVPIPPTLGRVPSFVHPDDAGQLQQALDAACDPAGTGVLENEHRVIRPDGTVRWILIKGQVQFDGRDTDRRPVRSSGIILDINDRKQGEEALRDLNKTLEVKVAQRTAQLQHRARQLQRLALEVSEAEDRERKHLAEVLHDDLQQQLAAAKFHLQMLGNRIRRDPPKQAIVTKVDHMLKDAIEKSRSLSHELSPAVLYHGNLVETLNWLAGQIQEKHGLIVHVDAVNEVTVRSDALKAFLYKATQELLFNVVKHARVNEARIRLRRMGRCVCLSVSDHGRGFDPQELRETAGFGLFSIRERIELLGGRMKIKSAKGQGSTFHIVVPDGQETQDRGPWTEDRAGLRGSSSVLRPPSSGPVLRVLLADDHEIVREGLASLLAEVPGIEVVGAAANGREVINLASQLRPDVVVMDVAMPLINGDEATRQIKLHLPGTRVVALSMYDEADLIEKMRQAGAEGYILKTAPAEDLVAAIRGR